MNNKRFIATTLGFRTKSSKTSQMHKHATAQKDNKWTFSSGLKTSEKRRASTIKNKQTANCPMTNQCALVHDCFGFKFHHFKCWCFVRQAGKKIWKLQNPIANTSWRRRNGPRNLRQMRWTLRDVILIVGWQNCRTQDNHGTSTIWTKTTALAIHAELLRSASPTPKNKMNMTYCLTSPNRHGVVKDRTFEHECLHLRMPTKCGPTMKILSTSNLDLELFKCQIALAA